MEGEILKLVVYAWHHMPITEVRAGGMEVFDSGTVTTFGEEPIEFTLEHEDDDDALELVFEFVEDGGEPDLETEAVDPEGTAKFRVYNHAGGDDVGPDEPFNIGVIGGRAIHLIYHVNAVDGDGGYAPTFSYTFYLGRDVDEAEVRG